MAFHLNDDYRLVNEIPSCSPSSPSQSSSPISRNQFLYNDGSSSFLSPSPHKKPNLNQISPIKEPVYYLTQGSSFNNLDGSRINNLQILTTKSMEMINVPSIDTSFDGEINLSKMIELNVANFSGINDSPLRDSISTLDATSSGDCSPVISVDGGGCNGSDGSDVYQEAHQLKLIQIPSNGNVIQVPSNLLVTSNDNLILCLPPEGITFQVEGTSFDSTISSMETSTNELFNTSNCNQLSSSSPSLTTLTPITFPDILQKSNIFDGDTINIQSPEIQLEKAQTWHKDSQLAIVALAALKATNKLTQVEMQ